MHPRFAQRILAPQEYASYLVHPQPQTYLYKAWAAKETGYKMICQTLGKKGPFSPAQFLYDEAAGTLTAKESCILLTFQVTERFIYCSAKSHQRPMFEATAAVAEILGNSQMVDERQKRHFAHSLAVRLLAQRLIAHEIKASPAMIHFGRHASGAPTAYCAGKLLPLELSFTHHGDFVAVAAGFTITA